MMLIINAFIAKTLKTILLSKKITILFQGCFHQFILTFKYDFCFANK